MRKAEWAIIRNAVSKINLKVGQRHGGADERNVRLLSQAIFLMVDQIYQDWPEDPLEKIEKD